MDYNKLCEMRDLIIKNKKNMDEVVLAKYEKHFDIKYTHNSTAIEGNTLSLVETKIVLEDNLSIGGKDMREIYEIVNHDKAFSYVKDCIIKQKPLSESIVKDIHSILMENIFTGGIYRDCEVIITGAEHRPPSPNDMYWQVKAFYETLPEKQDMDAITLAAYTHAEFVRIHPFVDGNGRTSRLIMNYQLMANGFLPISIAKENRLAYFETLEDYALNNDLTPFTEMIASLEEAQMQEYIMLIPKSKNEKDNTVASRKPSEIITPIDTNNFKRHSRDELNER